MEVKYYKVTSDRLNYPAYYAAYNPEEVKKTASSDFNSQFSFRTTQTTLAEIPKDAVILTAELSREDARKLAIAHG